MECHDHRMSGIVFLATRDLPGIVEFYTRRMNMDIWIEQEDCTIMRRDSFSLGFCQRESPDVSGIITFVVKTRQEVDDAYEQLKDLADGRPQLSEKYRIYHFFLRDPEGRMLEVQQFIDE